MKSITKKVISGALALCMAASTCLAADTTSASDTQTETTPAPKAVEMPESGTITKLSYEQLMPTMEAYSPTMLSLNESKAALNAFNREKARDSLLKTYNGLTDLSFAMGDSSTKMMIASQQSSLKTQLDALDEETYQKTYEDSILQIESSISQVTMGAQTLYINIATMEDQLKTTNQKIASLQRSLATTEKMYQLGLASSLTLETLKTNLSTAQSGAKSLEYQIKTCKQSLQQLMGSKTTGELTLSAVPEVTSEQVSAISYEADLEKALTKNANVVSSRHSMEDIKDDIDDATYGGYRFEQLRHNYQAAVETYNANVSTFKASFQTAYEAVSEKQRLIQTEENELALEKRNLDTSAYKYKLGLISRNTYLDQQDTYASAQADVSAAKLALYQAYNTYQWATQGVVS